MKELLKNNKILFGMILGIIFIVSTSVTYAWFGLTVSGNEDAKQMTVETGTLSLVFKDGIKIEGINIRPGWSQTKTFTVTNTGTFATEYNIIFKDLINEIERNELVVSYTCTSYTGYIDSNNKGTVSGTCNSLSNQAVPLSEGALSSAITENISIGLGITHEYTLTLLFKETNDNQNYNQGKDVNTEINITRYIENYDLNAQLLDSDSNPIANANVEIHSNPKYAQTDANGRFTIKDLEVGTHEIIVKDSLNNLIFTDNIQISGGEETSINNKLVTVNKSNTAVSMKIYKSNVSNIERIELIPNLYSKILIDNPTIKNDSSDLFANVADEVSESGLFRTTDLTKTEDVDGDGIGEEVLYFRGVVENNYLVFANYCWRIVRTNESGESIKLRYGGVYNSTNNTCPQTGTPISITLDGENTFYYSYNNRVDDGKYLKWVHQEGMDSNAKTVVEQWYTQNIETQGSRVTNLIMDEPFCNDMSKGPSYHYGQTYGAYGRANNPQYKCPQESDKYSVSKGNINKPIALLTSDEAAYAGGKAYTDNTTFYLYTSEGYLFMTPLFCFEYNAHIAGIGIYGDLPVEFHISFKAELVPSISIDKDAVIAGGGTGVYNNPYIVITN